MMKISAFAAPYGVANTHKEFILPRAFKGQLEACPMLFMHELPLGWWSRVWETKAGVWCEGEVDETRLARLEDKLGHDVPEISITFDQDCHGPAYKTETRAMGLDRMLLSPREIMSMHHAMRCHRENIVTFGPADLAGIVEISLVTRGAFPGTHWEIMPDAVQN